MIPDKIILFGILGVVFAFLVWGRVRYDLVAFGALVAAVIVGVVPRDQAFAGFGHPAVIIIALVLIASRGLVNSGAIEPHRTLCGRSIAFGPSPYRHHVYCGRCAVGRHEQCGRPGAADARRSAGRRQVRTQSGADADAALLRHHPRRARDLDRHAPNIVIASFREQALGEPLRMFEFAPVGIVVAIAGVIFVALAGWRLIPSACTEHDSGKELFDLDNFIAEVRVGEGSRIIGNRVRELDEAAEGADAAILGLVRRGERLSGQARRETIQKDGLLVVEASPRAIEELIGALGLEYVGSEKYQGALATPETVVIEVVVPIGARIDGRSALSLRLLYRHGVTLLGVSRRGVNFRERIRKLSIEAGDILLLYGPAERMSHVTDWLGCLPLAERGLQVIQRGKAMLTIAIFAAAIGLASIGAPYLPIALAAACVAMALFNIVPARQVYESVEWPIIVLLGSLIPIGAALEESGGAALIAEGIVELAGGASPAIVLTLLMAVTMTLSDVLNNTATAVIAAPIAVDIANRLSVNPDPFLMAVAVAASCAFLTPIGHKNNTLIMGPGGYRFGDYWRMGLPLEILVVALGVPAILFAWPF